MALRSMTFFNFLLESTLIGGALTVLVCILRHFFRVRLGSKLIYAAWLIVALRLLLPLSLPNPLMNEFRPTLSADADARPVADQVRTRFIDAAISLTRADERGFSPIGALGAQTIHGNAGRWVLLCYAFVGLSAAGCMVWRHERFRLRVSRDRASVLEGDALETYQTLCARWRVKPIPVYYVDGLHAQCTVGVRRPFIALPLGLPRDRLVPALTHEICHRRAGDSLWAFLRDLCCVLHWLNPLVWLAAQLSRADAELACDECATPALTPTERAAYAALLQSEQENRRAGLCVLATGVRFQGKALARRVEAVLCAERPCKRATAMSVVLGVCVLILSFATSESAPLPAPSYVPVVAWAASEVALDTPEEAIAYARRFLESEFIDEDTSAMGFEANVLEDGWRVYATMKGHALPLTLFPQPGRFTNTMACAC
ncbi:MAG: M56 family metallopeptidase [Clostridia bacterium]